MGGKTRPAVRAPDPPLTFCKVKGHMLRCPVSQHSLLRMEEEAFEMSWRMGGLKYGDGVEPDRHWVARGQVNCESGT